MFFGKSRGLPKCGATERYFNWVSSSLTSKHQTRMVRLAGDKHSSLLQTFVNYGHKSLGQGANVRNAFLLRNGINELECLYFQPSRMFVGKARSLPKCGSTERCFTWEVWEH
jgi:hypothetical protein